MASSELVFKTPLKRKRKLSSSGTPASMKKKPPKSFTIPPSPFLKRLGYGTGVSVYLLDRCETPGGAQKSPWAVKKLNTKLNMDSTSKDLMAQRLKYEAKILKEINHANIVGYRDTLRSEDGSFCLCMESGERSLMDILTERRESLTDCTPEEIHKVALGVSKALSYLHNECKLLHGDLKSANVLIKGDFTEVKLCDFGVCLKMKDDLSDLANADDCYVGTAAWSGREVLEGESITDRADIYSFGCLLYEMLSLNTPHMPPLSMGDDSMDDSLAGEDLYDEEIFEELLGTTPVLYRMDYDEEYFPYIALMTICCQEDPDRRPGAEEIVMTLNSLKAQTTAESEKKDSNKK